MKIVSFVLAEVTNPESGEVSKRFRAILEDGRDLGVVNTPEELKAHGSSSQVMKDLRLITGEYGDFLALPRYKTLASDVSWGDVVATAPVEDEDDDEDIAAAVAAAKAAKKAKAAAAAV